MRRSAIGGVVLVLALAGLGVYVWAQGTAFTPNGLAPTQDAAYDLGLAGQRFRNLYLSGTVTLSATTSVLGIGTATPQSGFAPGSQAKIYGPTFSEFSMQSGGHGVNLVALGSSGGTQASPTASQTGDLLGGVESGGYDGTRWISPAFILFLVDGAVAVGSVPQAITFSTGATPGHGDERLRIGSDGTLTASSLSGTGTSMVTASTTGVLGTATFGLTTTKTVRAAGGAGDCTLIFQNGLYVGGTC